MAYIVRYGRVFVTTVTLLLVVFHAYGQETVPGDSIRINPPPVDLFTPLSNMPPAIGLAMPDNSPAPSLIKPSRKPDFKMEPYPVFHVDKSYYRKGEYNVSGTIRNFSNGTLYGMGRHDIFPFIGTTNAAAIGYQHTFNDKFSMDLQLNAFQSNMPEFRFQSFGTYGNFTYQLNDHLRLRAFGAYSRLPANRYTTYDYGGTVNWQMSDRFGTEVGVRQHFNSVTKQWETIPIIVPHYKFSEKFTLGVDVGGILLNILRSVKVGPQNMNPTIRPSIP